MVSVTALQAGEAFNVIPQHAVIKGTVRSLSPEMRNLAEKRFREIVTGTCCWPDFRDRIRIRGYPVTFNHPPDRFRHQRDEEHLRQGGDRHQHRAADHGFEDFSFMLEERPGAYIFMGNGEVGCTTPPMSSTTRRSRA